MTCPHCHQLTHPGAHTCANCGTYISPRRGEIIVEHPPAAPLASLWVACRMERLGYVMGRPLAGASN